MADVGEALSNIPQALRIEHRQASTQKIPMTFKLPNGNPRDLTGVTFTFRLKETAEANDLIKEYTNNSGIVEVDLINGQIRLDIDDTVTPFPIGSLHYDFDEDSVADGKVPLFQGPFECRVDV